MIRKNRTNVFQNEMRYFEMKVFYLIIPEIMSAVFTSSRLQATDSLTLLH